MGQVCLRPFPFIRLPTELKLRIYTMVLCLPKSGVKIQYASASTYTLGVWDREHSDTSSIMSRPNYPQIAYHPPLSAGPLSSHLALLLTSKQIYQEAMPVFYSENNFITGLGPFDISLQALKPRCAGHIRHISVYWEPLGTAKTTVACFTAMKRMQNLRVVDIYFDTEEWKELKKPCNAGNTFIPEKLPGFAKLRDLYNTRQVTVYGDCDELRSALVAAQKQAREIKEQRLTKRKATAAGSSKGLGSGSKPKKAKKAHAASDA